MKVRRKNEFRKDAIIDYTREEFFKEFGINKKEFESSIEKMLNYYNIKKDDLQRDPSDSANYEIEYDIAPLIAVMFKTFKENPSYDRRSRKNSNGINKKATIQNIIQYNTSFFTNNLKFLMLVLDI